MVVGLDGRTTGPLQVCGAEPELPPDAYLVGLAIPGGTPEHPHVTRLPQFDDVRTSPPVTSTADDAPGETVEIPGAPLRQILIHGNSLRDAEK